MISPTPNMDELAARLARLEVEVSLLSGSALPRAVYTVDEFAKRVARAPYTVREWCRLGRIRATRQATGCGPYRTWVIGHAELVRYQQEGLLPSSDQSARREP